MTETIEGKVGVITGAGSGLGAAARHLAAQAIGVTAAPYRLPQTSVQAGWRRTTTGHGAIDLPCALPQSFVGINRIRFEGSFLVRDLSDVFGLALAVGKLSAIVLPKPRSFSRDGRGVEAAGKSLEAISKPLQSA